MNTLSFLLSNLDSVIVVLVLAAVFIYLIVKKQYALLNTIIFSLVTEAEKRYGSGTGALKLAAEIEWVYPKIPALIKMFISATQLEKLINSVLDGAKIKWEKNPNILTYIGKKTDTV